MPSATVVGAGVFGAWIARALLLRGWTVTLIEQHGPANARASSGGETRIIRSAYGDHSLYAIWARDAVPRWQSLERETGIPLFTPTGALFIGCDERWLRKTLETLGRVAVRAEWMDASALASRYPQLTFRVAAGAVFEPDAGVLFARRAVQALVQLLLSRGVRLVLGRADPTVLLQQRHADALVFAAGAWLPTLLPELLGDFIRPTRQEVFFFGPPRPEVFNPEHFPAWVAFEEGIYGVPDLEHRGVKVAIDAHGVMVDPESMERVVDANAILRIREVLHRRIPVLADAPLLESRVCQYENTPDGHLLLDRMPGHDRVWIAGGGSGHGFKHGPSVGEYMADLIEGHRQPERMFSLGERPERARAVY